MYVQEHGYDTRADLQDQYTEITKKKENAKSALSSVSAELKSTNMELRHLGRYYSCRRVYQQFQKSKNKKKFRQEHAAELEEYKKHIAWLEERFPDGKLLTMKELQEKSENLKQRKDKHQVNYEYYRDYEKDLKTVSANVDAILDTPAPEKKKSRDQELS